MNNCGFLSMANRVLKDFCTILKQDSKLAQCNASTLVARYNFAAAFC